MEEALKLLITAEGAGPFGAGINPLPRQVIRNHGILQRGARSKQQSLLFHIPLDCEWHFPFCPFILALFCTGFYSALVSCWHSQSSSFIVSALSVIGHSCVE